MAVIDYGVIYKVDGKFINKNGDLFEDAPKWAPNRVYELNEDITDPNSGTDLVQNSYACVGEPDFYIFFFKDIFVVCSGRNILRIDRGAGGAPSIKYFFNSSDVSVSHLDKTIYGYDSCRGDDVTSTHRRQHKYKFYYRTRRFLATWEYGGHKYEVIFGYGIKVGHYDFTDIERNIIDSWFNET